MAMPVPVGADTDQQAWGALSALGLASLLSQGEKQGPQDAHVCCGSPICKPPDSAFARRDQRAPTRDGLCQGRAASQKPCRLGQLLPVSLGLPTP